MPTDVHPLLRPKEEIAETPVEAPVEEAEAPVEEIPEVPVAEKERRVIDLDAEDLYQQIVRYRSEDPRFANVYNTDVGRKAAKDYQPRITKLEADNARLQTRLREIEAQGMDEEAIKERLLNDPGFRRTYGEAPGVDANLIEMRGQLQAAIARVEEGVSLEPAQLQQFQAMLYRGDFDAERDQAGRVIRQLSPNETIAWYSSYLHQQERAATKPPAPQPQEAPVAEVEVPQEEPAKPAPKPNTRLAQLNPDLTPASTSTGPAKMALSEYQKLSPPQRIAMFPTGAEYEEARRNGTIYDG